MFGAVYFFILIMGKHQQLSKLVTLLFLHAIKKQVILDCKNWGYFPLNKTFVQIKPKNTIPDLVGNSSAPIFALRGFKYPNGDIIVTSFNQIE